MASRVLFLITPDVGQKCQLSLQNFRHSLLPVWEVRCNVLVPRMSRNILRRDLEASHWCVLREDSGTLLGIDYLAAISNSSECAAGNPGGAPQVVTILWNAGVQVNPKIATKVWRPVYLNCRYLFLRRAFDIHRSRSCRSHAGNRSGSCGLLSHLSFEPAKFEQTPAQI